MKQKQQDQEIIAFRLNQKIKEEFFEWCHSQDKIPSLVLRAYINSLVQKPKQEKAPA